MPRAPKQKVPKKHRKAVIIFIVVVLLAGAAGAAGWWYAGTRGPQATPAPAVKASPTPAPTPATKLSPLTGLAVTPDLADRPVSAIVIENLNPDARPQSGLGQAGVVYEALAEGGITRFLAIFLDERPASIGPVRSLRPYFIDWGMEFDSPVAHAGGSGEALALVGPTGMKDINALGGAHAGAFYRTTDRRAPHNLYTNSDRMDALLGRLGFAKPAAFTPSPRKKDTPTTTPPQPVIRINYSTPGYNVEYRYDGASNTYGRFMAGVPHTDRNTGQQIRVKNVVVEMMPTTTLSDGHLRMTTVGSGSGWVFRDGAATPITWKKDARNVRTKLLDAAGKDVELNPGNTWYSIVPIGRSVTF
jgi:hypothetical protein